MAGGDLGELMFSLGIKDNVSNDLDSILRKFINMDASVNKTTDALRKLASKIREASDIDGNGPSKEFLKLADSIDGSAARIVKLRSEIRKTSDAINNIKAIPNFMQDSNLMSSLNKLQGYLRTLNGIDSNKILDGGRISAIFSNGARSIQEANASLRAYNETAKQTKLSMEQNARATRDFVSSFDRAHSSIGKTSDVLNDLKGLILNGGIIYGAQQFAMSIIQTGGEIEKQHIALQSIIGDLQNANELFGQIKELALASPFTFSELNRDVKQLAAFGVETDQLYDKTKRIADISAGLGVSFERLGLAYGQVKARSWLDGKELRQFAYAGLPMLEKIANMYTRERGRSYTTRDVRDMITKREVSFEDVDKIFDELTDKGGQFYQMQNTLSETLLGRFLKLKDAWEIMLSGFARGDSVVGGFFKKALNGITAVVQGLDKMGPVILAAFSGFAIKRAGIALGGSTAKDILSAKSNLAARYQEKALTGELSAVERQILATKRQITAQDLKTLASSGAITRQELQRLLLSRKITSQQYAQAMAVLATSNNMTALSAKTQILLRSVAMNGGTIWQRFKLGGMAAFSLLGTGAKALGATLWSAIGGLPGLIITGATMALTYLWQKSEELKQAQQQATDELENRNKSLKEFIDTNDISNAITKGGQDLENSIESYKDKLKEIAPYNYNAYMMTANEKSSHEERLKYLKKQLDLLLKANEISKKKSNKFIEDFKGDFEGLSDNRKNYRKQQEQGFSIGMRANDNQFNMNIRSLAAKLSEEFPHVATDPKMREAMKMLRANIYSQLSVDPEDQLHINVKLDELMGLDPSSNFSEKVEDKLRSVVDNPKNKIILKNGVTEYASTIAEKIKNGQQLTKAEEELLRKCYKQAIAQLKKDYPEYATNLQKLLNDSQFYANVKVNFVGTRATGLQSQIYKNFPTLGDNYAKARNLATSWIENESVYDAINNGRKEIDKRYNEWQSRNKAFKKGKITEAEVRAAKANYDESVLALKTGYGDEYTGEPKKSNKSGKKASDAAKREWEKQQRKILKGWQERKRLLEEYYETWNKWRNIEGKDNAKGHVRSDKRFASVSNEFKDPEVLGENLDKLAVKYSKLAKTEEQLSFVRETRAEAAKREADLELELAEKSMRSLSEKLDLLSKQYTMYQKLAKVAGSSTAAHYAFGSSHIGLAGEWSYYEYLKDYLNGLNGKVNIKPFINGGNGNSKQEATIYARALKGVDFSKYGGLEGVLQMSDSRINDEFGKDRDLSKMLIDFKKEVDKLDEKIADTLVSGYTYFQNYDEEIKAINKSYDEQIERLEERNRLNRENDKYISDEALRKGKVVLEQQRERDKANVNMEAMKHSKDYYNFFGAITTLNTKDAEAYANSIRELVNKAFQSGAIDAREYSKQIKQINEQMDKLNNQHSDFITYIQGGLDAVVQKYKTKGDELQARGSFDYGEAQRNFQKAKVDGDLNGISKSIFDMQQAKGMQANGEAMSKAANNMKGTVSVIDAIVNGINNIVQGMKRFVDQIADDFDTMGKGGNGIRDSKGYQFVSGFSEASQGAADGWNNLKNGNVMGAVTGVYRSFSGWWTGFARTHDAKLERQIQIAERQLKALGNLQNSIERHLKTTLGGVYHYKSNEADINKIKDGLNNYSLAKNGVEYGHDTRLASKAIGAGTGIAVGAGSAALAGAMLGSAVGPIGAAVGAAVGAIAGFVIGGLFGHKKRKHETIYQDDTNVAMERANQTREYYDQQYAVMKMQRDQMEDKLNKEKEKKKKDEGKIDDYESQLAEVKEKIATFAMDMAKNLYQIDLKSWASELTKAIVDAWTKGEDAAKAYHDKVKDLMRNLATNIISTRIMEYNLKSVEALLQKKMTDKSGKLDADDIIELADELDAQTTKSVDNITAVLERLKAHGWDLSQNGSNSISNGIKSITEETADIIASYLNAIRLDVSVNRVTLQRIYDSVSTLSTMNIIASAQLSTLNAISANTLRNADYSERILRLLNEVTTPGVKKVNIN